MTNDPTSRFSDRVTDYVKYRPTYPSEAIDAIIERAQLSKRTTIADVGSGTGISSRPFLERGYSVMAIEPNDAMREAAEADLASFKGFESVDGTAEKTGLPSGSVSLAVAAQAFHWFRSDDARKELHRIVAPPHCVALMWNERLTDTPFLKAYEAALLEHGIDYDKVDHRNVDAAKLEAFFAGPSTSLAFPNAQRFDRAGFVGRALSSSYVPQRGHEKHDAMMHALDALFAAHAKDGHVEFRYSTAVHIGSLV